MTAGGLAPLHELTLGGPEVSRDGARDGTERLLREYAAGPDAWELPEPAPPPGRLAGALAARRSTHQLGDRELDAGSLSTLLAHAAGSGDRAALPVSADRPPANRTYPSGGALYAVETIVATREGFRRYQPLGHRLVPVAPAAPDLPGLLADHPVGDAATVLLLVADLAGPSLERYGGKAYRLMLLEAGHLAQNVLLVAAALGLPTLPLCGFRDRELALAAGLRPPQEAVLYAIAVGGRP